MNVDLLNDFKETKRVLIKANAIPFAIMVRFSGMLEREKEKGRMTKYGHSENLTSIMVI